jgi:hypothetical protein
MLRQPMALTTARGLLGSGPPPGSAPRPARLFQTYVRLDAREASSSAGNVQFAPGALTSLELGGIAALDAGFETAPLVTRGRKRRLDTSPAPPPARRAHRSVAAAATGKPQLPLSVPSVRPPSAADKRLHRAKRRATRASAVAPSPLQTAAEADSVGEATKKLYQAAYSAFLAWAKKKGHLSAKRAASGELDNLLVAYLDSELYRKGCDAADAKNAIFGTIFCRSLPKGSNSLPRCRRALAGFLKDEPPTSEDPCPIEAAAVIALALLKKESLETTLSALAFLVSYDLFTRPSELLSASPEDVVVPSVGQYQGISLVVAPMRKKGETHTVGRKPAKSGEFDDTVIANLPGLGLGFVGRILHLTISRT